MKSVACKVLAAVALSGLLLAGCETREIDHHHPVTVTPAGAVAVAEQPPPPREEIINTAPTVSTTWEPGYWTYANWSWVWVQGRWHVRPKTDAVWLPGHWDRTPRGWVWKSGRWE